MTTDVAFLAAERVAGTVPAAATAMLTAIIRAQELLDLLADTAGQMNTLKVRSGRDGDVDLIDAVDEIDGTLVLQGMLIESRQVLDSLIGDDDDLTEVLAGLTPLAERFAEIDALRAGPLGQAALAGCSGGPDGPPERVSGLDGKSYPESAAKALAQRAQIAAVIADHPDWSARRVAREVGCSQNTVIAVQKAPAS